MVYFIQICIYLSLIANSIIHKKKLQKKPTTFSRFEIPSSNYGLLVIFFNSDLFLLESLILHPMIQLNNTNRH